MARDAITRQYDVDKNLVTLTCETDKGSYRPGKITFYPKKGRSLDLGKLHESLVATRLSGGTSMSVDWLEISARGEVFVRDKDLVLKLSGTGQEFLLLEEPGAKDAIARLREQAARGANVNSVTGLVPGWKGRFPAVLRALETPGTPTLLVTDFSVK
jgi:hypothetical protein